jgi:hypothetical protein
MFLQNVGSYQSHTASYTRRLHSSWSPPWKPQVLHHESLPARRTCLMITGLEQSPILCILLQNEQSGIKLYLLLQTFRESIQFFLQPSVPFVMSLPVARMPWDLYGVAITHTAMCQPPLYCSSTVKRERKWRCCIQTANGPIEQRHDVTSCPFFLE